MLSLLCLARNKVVRQEYDKEFERVYIQYYVRMKRFAREYVVSEEDAENILQDVFLDLWEKREVLVTHVNLIAFLFTAIRNRCIDWLRRKTLEEEAANRLLKEHLLTLRINLDSLRALDADLFKEEDAETIINRAIASLPAKCREIFIRSKIEGKKQREIAEELNISINTVETQMSIAYKKLRENLKDVYPLFLFLFYL